jgi:enoyl-CoA hydratase
MSITVDRPEKRNAMDIETRRSLRDAFAEAEADENIRVVVLRGAGDSAFISGGDLDSFAEWNVLDSLEYATKHSQGLYNYIAGISKPTIAAIDGHALGGGLEIAMACDIRLSTAGVKLGLPEVTLGVLPGGGGTQRLATLVGAGKAKEMILTGNTIDAGTAREIGLVNHVYPEEEFEEAVAQMAMDVATNAPIAMRLAKESMNHSIEDSSSFAIERLAFAVLFATQDQSTGIEAFLQDSEPTFEGR